MEIQGKEPIQRKKLPVQPKSVIHSRFLKSEQLPDVMLPMVLSSAQAMSISFATVLLNILERLLLSRGSRKTQKKFVKDLNVVLELKTGRISRLETRLKHSNLLRLPENLDRRLLTKKPKWKEKRPFVLLVPKKLFRPTQNSGCSFRATGF